MKQDTGDRLKQLLNKAGNSGQLESMQAVLNLAHADATVEATRRENARNNLVEDLVPEMVTRFLSWKLPKDFYPDAGISFKADYNEGTQWPMKHEPLGTNLFHAGQAEGMIRHMLGLPNKE